MGMSAVRGLATHQDLFQLFQTNPLGSLDQLEQRTGVKLPGITRGQIAIMQSMSLDDFKALVDICDKVRTAGSEYFKIG
jgi:hypothetical protein